MKNVEKQEESTATATKTFKLMDLRGILTHQGICWRKTRRIVSNLTLKHKLLRV